MADIQANIGIGVDTTQALASIRQLQREISVFHTLMAKGSATNAAKSAQMQQGLINTINETGRFSAGMTNISSSTESFTNALEKNKLSMGQYFRYAGGASRSFGKMFSREFSTISRVAQERVKDLQTQYVSMGRDANGALQAIKVRPLALDMNNLGTKVQMVAQKQQLFNQLLKQGSTNLLNFGKNTQWAGRQLMVGFTIPLTMFGVAASREFMKLEEQVVKFKRVYGDMFTTDSETDKALNNVRELANEFTKYGIAVEKTIGLAAKVAQMGNVGTDLTAQVTQATRLAVLGGMEQEDALDTTISLTNAFGIAAEDLAGKIAFLNAAENQTILSIEDFNEAIPKAGSVVQQLGGSVEDLAFFLTAMREGGINASQGANALKTSLARIVAPTEVAKKEMAGFGIDIVGIVENNVGNLKQTIVELGQELDSLDPLNRARAIEQLFGKFQFARMSTMFQNISKDGSQAQKVLDLTANSTEELAIIAERELARVEDSVSFKFQKQLEKLQESLAPIGAEFLKAVTPLVEFGTKLLNMFNNLGDGGKQFAVIAIALAGVVLPAALMGFGLVANGIANLIKFVAFLGTGFARLSGQSRILGTGTEYMTQEQIQAAAVAASLGQAHSNLLQVFTAESGAVQQLVSSYRAATLAQRDFAIGAQAASIARMPIGPQRKPQGFAKGVLSVPGPKGAGDVVPAMLSPGEAVIPADKAQRYMPILSDIMSDRLPGYEGGYGVVRTHASMPFSQDSPQYQQGVQSSGFASIPAQLQKYVTVVSNLVAELPQSLNIALQKGTATVENFKSEWESREGKFTETARRGGLDTSDPENVAALQQIENEIGERAVVLAQGTSDQMVNDDILAQATQELINEYRDRSGAMGAAAGALHERSQTVGQVRLSVPKEEMQRARARGIVTRTPGTTGLEANGVNVGRVSSTDENRIRGANPYRPAGSYSNQKLRSELKDAGVDAGEGLVDGVEQSLQIASPSKRMFGLGKNAADSLADGFQQGMADETGKPPLPRKPGDPPLPPEPQTGRMGPDGKIKGRMQRLKNRVKVVGNKALDASMETGPGKRVANYFAETSGANITNSKGKVVSDLHQEVKELGNASDRAADQVKENTQQIEENAQSAKRNSDATDKQVRKADRAQKRQARAGKALGALGTATMVAGMATQVDGKVGEVAQKLVGPMAALSGIAPLLMALPAPIAALVAVIGASVGAFMLYNSTMKKAREESARLASALGAGKDAVQKFADFAGRATSSEIMDKQRQAESSPFQVQPGKTTFGDAFVEGEAGAAFVADVRQGMAKIGKDATIQRVYQQLGQSIISGALTAPEAKSIASSIGAELEDYEFSMKIRAEIAQLIGPSGEDLPDDPVRLKAVAEQLSQDIQDSAQAAFEGLASGPTAAEIATKKEENTGFLGFFKNFFVENTIKEEKMADALAQIPNILSSTQQSLDSIDVANLALVNAAVSEGDFAGAETARANMAQERSDFLQTVKEGLISSVGQILESEQGDAAIREQQARVQNAEGLDPLVAQNLKDAFSQLNRAFPQGSETSVTLTSLVEAGALTEQGFIDLIESSSSGEDLDASLELILKIGGAEAAQVVALSKLFEDEQLSSDFVASFSVLDPDQAFDKLQFFNYLQNASEIFDGQLEIPLEFYQQNPTAAQDAIDNIQELQALSVEDGFSFDIVAQVYGQEAADRMKVVAEEMGEEFDDLDEKGKLDFSVMFNIGTNLEGDRTFLDMIRNNAKGDPFTLGLGRKIATVVPDFIAPPAPNTDNNEPVASEDGGATKSVDSLITKLRDLRIATIDMQKGWQGMQETLSSIFAGGAITQFNGLEKQIRNLGVGEGLIAQIVGMDPDEYEKRKNELFEFDNFGNIIGAKAALTNMNEAFDAVAIGDYVNGQEKFIQKTKNQNSAIQTLVASGMSLADAYEAVQDEALAAAIAQGATREEIEEILRITGLAKEMEAQLEAQRERSRISESVRNTNEEFRNQVAVLKELSKAQGQYTDEQIKALMSDKDLQKLMLDPSIDSGALKEALRNAEQQANLEVSVNLLTKTGQETEFDKYLTEVNDYFTKKENAINVNFDLATAADNKLIEEAQNQLAAIQYELDDYNAELERISWQEDDINEKYDKRAEALDNVAKANERINSLQKAQLSIAEALSRGDISAAATAQQELASQQAKEAQERSKENLEKQRKLELGTVVGATGLTRKELEEEIQTLERKVFEIEETISEPAQERNRIAAIARDLAIEQLQLNEMTRAEFDQIAASTKEAAMNLEDMATSAEKLVALSEYIKTGIKDDKFNELFPQPKAAAPSKPSSSSSRSSSPAPATSPAPAPDPTPTGTINNSSLSNKAFRSVVRADAAKFGALTSMRPPRSSGLGGYTPGMAMGGSVKGYPMGGLIPYKSEGGFFKSLGSDTVPAMLTPGEYVVRRPAVKNFGVKNLEDINRGTYGGESMYNYNLQVNVKSDSDPNKIANTVMRSIKQIEGQKLRGNRI